MKFTNFHLVSFFLCLFVFFQRNESSSKELSLSLGGYKVGIYIYQVLLCKPIVYVRPVELDRLISRKTAYIDGYYGIFETFKVLAVL